MWARISVRADDGSEMDFEVGSDEACYPDAVSECVAGVLRLYVAATAEG